MIAMIFFCCAIWLIWWLAAEAARAVHWVKDDWPYHKVYIEIMKHVCGNLTLFGKIVIGGSLSIFLLPGIIIVPIMHFILDVFKAAIFK